MSDILARIKVKGKNFEIMVDSDKAVAFKKGQGNVNIGEVLIAREIFSDVKKGLVIKEAELQSAFNTKNVDEIAGRIIKEGEIQLPKEYKDAERENKMKQIVSFISTNCVDPKGMPHPPQRIEAALKQIHLNIQNKPIEEQIPEILKEIQKILPLKMEIKKLSVIVPAIYTGHLYGILKQYMIKEDWLSDGSLQCIISLPAGIQMSFFDKINNMTHGTVITQEIKG